MKILAAILSNIALHFSWMSTNPRPPSHTEHLMVSTAIFSTLLLIQKNLAISNLSYFATLKGMGRRRPCTR